MWIIFTIFLSFHVLCLESFEMLSNVKILRVLPDNIVMINRGLEDGILRNDHAKFSNEVAGYSSRAICVKASINTSYWKLYRIPESEAFSMDYTYTITGMADKEIPVPTIEIRNKVMSAELILIEKYKETIELLKEHLESQKQLTQVYKEYSVSLLEQLNKTMKMVDELVEINKKLLK